MDIVYISIYPYVYVESCVCTRSLKKPKYMMIIHPKIKDLLACRGNLGSCHTRTLNKCIICTHICCRCRHLMFFLSVLFCLFIWQSQKLSTSVRVSLSNKKDPHIGSLILNTLVIIK